MLLTINVMQDTKYILLSKILDGVFTSAIWYSFSPEYMESLCQQLSIDVKTLYDYITLYCRENNIPLIIGGEDE